MFLIIFYLFGMTSQILSSITLLITDWTVVNDTTSVRVHVFFELKKFVCLVITLSAPILIDAMVIVQTCHHAIVFQKTFTTNLTSVWKFIEMGRFSVIL